MVSENGDVFSRSYTYHIVLILVLVEDGLGDTSTRWLHGDRGVLILVLVEDGLGDLNTLQKLTLSKTVLILVLVEDGLGAEHL